MAKATERSQRREFLVVALPESADTGATMRLLGVAGTQAAAEKLVEELSTGTTGRVAVLERKALFVRRPAIETVELDAAISKG